ncbi:MAG: Crp/Fnr family transcriptional regulator [Gemmatimonadaceae bacterium]|nr:Crp/Fnr family transcriptional regulator [Acetobacteraceae bacterium]
MKVIPAAPRAAAAMNILHRHRILGAAPAAELQAMLARSHVVEVEEREPLFHQGDVGRAVVVVMDGFVKLSCVTGGGREVVLEICGPGSLFGELAVLNDWPRSADAIALSRSEVLSIGGDAFRTALAHSPDAMFALIGVLSRRLRLASEQVMDNASLSGGARLAKALGQLAAVHSRPVAGGLRLELSITQRELGGLTGLSRERINKQLAAWRDLGWVKLSPPHITLLAVEALRALVHDAAEA